MADKTTAALNEAADRKFVEMGFTPANAEQLKQQAMEMLQNPEHAQRLQDMKKMATFVGAPVTQIILDRLTDLGDASSGVKKKLHADIEKQTGTDKKKGSMEFKFKDRETRMDITANIFLGECNSEYDCGAELDKIKNRMTDAEWAKTLREISQFIGLAQAYYNNFVKERASLTDVIGKHLPRNVVMHPLKLNPLISILYLENVTDLQIGLFVVIS